MVLQCCVCKRVHVDAEWVRVANPEVIARTASHGYCPTCAARAYAEFQALNQSRDSLPPAA